MAESDDSRRRGGITLGEVRTALTIAGSDSGGGAGIQADLKTFTALGVFGTTAITAVTIQNTKGVEGYEELSPETVGGQIRAVATDIGVHAAKTGMLASAGIIEAVADALVETRVPNLVVDPVFVSKHGHPLLQDDAVEALRTRILPLATLVTPNLPEAAGLTGLQVEAEQDMRRAGEAILELGAGAVLVKGGHLSGPEATDLLVTGDGAAPFSSPRVDTPHTHGTGCVLSAAIAARLALGDELQDAVRGGKEFVTGAIRGGLEIGEGIGPVDPAWRS
ncbi:MAG TPA: bifunctional hydroxymethylpyrimidine kinase/phosphomethylpyrimidine kinase [Actinomycetota bacterium]